MTAKEALYLVCLYNGEVEGIEPEKYGYYDAAQSDFVQALKTALEYQIRRENLAYLDDSIGLTD